MAPLLLLLVLLDLGACMVTPGSPLTLAVTPW